MNRSLETIRGEVLSLRIIGNDFWGTAGVRTDDGDVTVTGKLVSVSVGETAELRGQWTEHPRWGRQFKVIELTVVQPTSAAGIVAWMAGRLPQLGKRRAAELVDTFGPDGIWEVIENEPDRLLEVKGITPKRRDAIVDAYRTHREERDRMVQFKTWGLSDGQIARVIETWGEGAESRMRANPFDLIQHVHGFGFDRADAVAQRMGIAPTHPGRIRAGILFTLDEAKVDGHTYLLAGALIGIAARMLRVPKQCVMDELFRMRDAKAVVGGRGRARIPSIARAEKQVATRVLEMLRMEGAAA